jgi:hypothetical protein
MTPACSAAALIAQHFPVDATYPIKVQRLANRQPPIILYDKLLAGDQYWSIPNSNMVVKLEPEHHFVSLGLVAGGPAQFKRPPGGRFEELKLSTR